MPHPFRLPSLALALILVGCATPPVVAPPASPPPVSPQPMPPAQGAGPRVGPAAPGSVPEAAGSTPAPAGRDQPTQANLQPVGFADLPGWQQDDLSAAWPAWDQNCKALRTRAPWAALCAQSLRIDRQQPGAAREFFERYFTPHALLNPDGSQDGLVTGYYEPLLRGSRQRRGVYQHPLYKAPGDLIQVDLASVLPELRGMRLRGRLVGNKVMPYPSRAEIENSPYGQNPANVLAWVDDPVEAFFLGVQGSGRIRLDEGGILRAGFADSNGHPYKSIGKILLDQGAIRPDQATMQGIKAWVNQNPQRGRNLLQQNPSLIFFRELPHGSEEGPPGALNAPLTAGRSIAVDPRYVALGTPVFLSTSLPGSTQPLQRLVFAQDTGSAIRGAVRADWFAGTGDAAGEVAGRMKQSGRMFVLLPR